MHCTQRHRWQSGAWGTVYCCAMHLIAVLGRKPTASSRFPQHEVAALIRALRPSASAFSCKLSAAAFETRLTNGLAAEQAVDAEYVVSRPLPY